MEAYRSGPQPSEANATSASEYNGHKGKLKTRINMEAYRSGHNGHDWKSCSLNGLRGSNPLASAKAKGTPAWGVPFVLS